MAQTIPLFTPARSTHVVPPRGYNAWPPPPPRLTDPSVLTLARPIITNTSCSLRKKYRQRLSMQCSLSDLVTGHYFGWTRKDPSGSLLFFQRVPQNSSQFSQFLCSTRLTSTPRLTLLYTTPRPAYIPTPVPQMREDVMRVLAQVN